MSEVPEPVGSRSASEDGSSPFFSKEEGPRVLALTHDYAFVDRLNAALTGLAFVYRADPREDAAELAATEVRPQMCFIDIDIPREDLPLLLSALGRAASRTDIIAIGDIQDVDVALACLRAGVVDVLPRHMPENELRRRAEDRLRGPFVGETGHPTCPLLVLTAVGAAETAIYIALGVALRSQKENENVLFLDLSGGIHELEIALNIKIPYDVDHALRDITRIDSTLLSTAVARHGRSGLALIASQKRHVDGMWGKPELLDLLSRLRMFYKEVVLYAPLEKTFQRPAILNNTKRFAVLCPHYLPAIMSAVDNVQKCIKQGIASKEKFAFIVHDFMKGVSPRLATLSQGVGMEVCLAVRDCRAAIWNAVNQGEFAVWAGKDRSFIRSVHKIRDILSGASDKHKRSFIKRLF